MESSYIQSSRPVYTGKSSEEKADCLYYAKITAFAISVILLVAGILALSGAFGNLGEEIGWTLAPLGIIGLSIGYYLCSNNPSTTNSLRRDASNFSSTSQMHYPWLDQQEKFQYPRDDSNPFGFGTSPNNTQSARTRSTQPPGKSSVINRVRSDPKSFQNLSYNLRNDEEVVVAALNGCKNSEQAKRVISSATYKARNSKKVAFALIRKDPTLLEQLIYDVRNDEEVVVAALNGCKNSEQAKMVINSATYKARNSKKVAFALIRKDPTLLGLLNYGAKNDLEVVLLAINLSTERTIEKIWSSIGMKAALNKEVRAKVKEKYPNFFQDRTFDDAFPNFFQYGTFQGFPYFNTQNIPNQTPHGAAKTSWVEPDDLKGNTSEGANVARKILKQSHLLDIDLTRTKVSKEVAKRILCRLLELDVNISNKDLKYAYHKASVRIHPDKLELQSGGEAFKALGAAYEQANL